MLTDFELNVEKKWFEKEKPIFEDEIVWQVVKKIKELLCQQFLSLWPKDGENCVWFWIFAQNEMGMKILVLSLILEH